MMTTTEKLQEYHGATLSVERMGTEDGVVLSVNGRARVVIANDYVLPELIAQMIERSAVPGDEERVLTAWQDTIAVWLQSERHWDVFRAFCDVTQVVDRGRWAMRPDSEPCDMCRARQAAEAGDLDNDEGEEWKQQR